MKNNKKDTIIAQGTPGLIAKLMRKYKDEETLWEKIIDFPSTIYYNLGGGYIDDFKIGIYQTYRAIINYKNGFGFIKDSDLWSLPDAISPFVSSRLKLFKQKIIDGDIVTDWSFEIAKVNAGALYADAHSLKCGDENCPILTPEVEYAEFLSILDDIIFAFDYCRKNGDMLEDEFLIRYGREMDWSIAGEKFNASEKHRQLKIELQERQKKGLKLFAKYYETLWW